MSLSPRGFSANALAFHCPFPPPPVSLSFPAFSHPPACDHHRCVRSLFVAETFAARDRVRLRSRAGTHRSVALLSSLRQVNPRRVFRTFPLRGKGREEGRNGMEPDKRSRLWSLGLSRLEYIDRGGCEMPDRGSGSVFRKSAARPAEMRHPGMLVVHVDVTRGRRWVITFVELITIGGAINRAFTRAARARARARVARK